MRFLVVLGLLMTVVTAQAEIVFSPSFSYFKEEVESSGVTSETEMSTYDFKLGYLGGSGLFLGGMYQMRSSGDLDGSAAGPTLGFSHYSGFYALFTYFVMATQDLDATTELTDGMGPQIDVGWVFPITRVFMLGPQITYRSIGYDKVESGGISADADVTQSTILPYITLWFRF